MAVDLVHLQIEDHLMITRTTVAFIIFHSQVWIALESNIRVRITVRKSFDSCNHAFDPMTHQRPSFLGRLSDLLTKWVDIGVVAQLEVV